MNNRPPTAGSAGNPLYMTFKDTAWPANAITPGNVLEYFSNPQNPFYDTSSCNQIVKMQQNVQRMPLEENLLKMTGIQYVLWSAQPPLYVICKHRRNNPHNVTPLAYYYIINGVVYQSPDTLSFVQSRLLAAVDPLKKAFDEVMQYSRYNVAKGYSWEFKDKPKPTTVDDDEKDDTRPTQVRSSNFQAQRTQMLMRHLFEQFPPLDGVELGAFPTEVKKDDDAQSTAGSSVAMDTAHAALKNPGSVTGAGNMDPPAKKAMK